MKFFKFKNNNKGFTILEALVAISILSISVAGMIGVTASSMSYSRYASDSITANYLLEEAIDSVRNSRDSILKKDSNDWGSFLSKYSSCFNQRGCILDVEKFSPTVNLGDVALCSSTGCSPFYYDNNTSGNYVFYNYRNVGVLSRFTRMVKMTNLTTDHNEVKVVATVTWTNGSSQKSQSLETYLSNWQN